MNCITFTKINTIKNNSLNIKHRIKLDYKKLRPADDYQYPPEEEQEEQEEQKEQEKIQEEQEKTKTDIDEFNKYITE